MTRAEKYVYKVCQTKSFSVAAKELYVSQPALSITIKKLETELGYEIFNRKKSPVTLTGEGELYIEYLEEAMELERSLRQRISTLHDNPSTKLSVGGSNSIAYYILPKICGEFYRRFPNVILKIDNGTNFHDKLNQGSLDLAIDSNCDFSRFNAVDLWREKYVIVVRKDYPGVEKLRKYSLSRNEILSGKFSKDKEITDLRLLKNIKFFKPGPNSNAWKKMPELMEQCSSSPCRVVNFKKMDISYQLMLEGLGALITPQITLLEASHKSDQLDFFSLGFPNNVRQARIIYKKDFPLSTAAKEFIAIAREMYGTKEKLFGNLKK